MWGFLESLLDLIAPRKERAMHLARYDVSELMPCPHVTLFGTMEIVSLSSYKTRAVEDCIRALKYDDAPRAAGLLAMLLGEYLREEIDSSRALSPRTPLIVPVPLHPNRESERGFNQIERIIAALPPDLAALRCRTPSLIRTRETMAQTKLSRAERLENVRDAFAIADPEALRGRHVFLIDDVTTTGATLAAAAAPLHALGIPTSAIALARA